MLNKKKVIVQLNHLNNIERNIEEIVKLCLFFEAKGFMLMSDQFQPRESSQVVWFENLGVFIVSIASPTPARIVTRLHVSQKGIQDKRTGSGGP